MTNVKKILAILLALCIVCGGTSVLAAGQTVTYTSPTSRYQAQKFSHPDAGVGEIDGIIEYDSGENDRGQNYSWSAQGYGDYMYVGTCYAAIYATINIMAKQSGVDVEVFKAGLNALYNGTLYMGDLENNPSDARRSILVRVNVRTGEVKLVAEPKNMGGYRASITYNGKLYFVAADASPYLLEIDPENNDATQVVYTCARPSDPFISVGIRGLAVVNGMLIASMIGDNGTYIVASENPSAGQASFETIGTQEDLLDYPAYMYNDSIFGGAIWDMIGFQDKLYFTVVTGKAGNKQAFAMFCGEQDEATGEWSYRLIIGDEADGARYPFGLGADRSGAANLIVHDGYLYIGEYNDEEIPLEEGKDVLQSIADYYMWRNQCPRAMGPENIIARKKYIFDLAEKYRADGIIVENMKFCEYWGYERAQDGMWFYEGYELPRSIPVCQIEKDYTSAASGQLRTRFQAFIESLEIKKIQAQQ